MFQSNSIIPFGIEVRAIVCTSWNNYLKKKKTRNNAAYSVHLNQLCKARNKLQLVANKLE